jgi:hypothetical protein
MIEDVIYDSLIFVYETPNEPSGGDILGYSYDGDNYDFSSTGVGEVSVIFIN